MNDSEHLVFDKRLNRYIFHGNILGNMLQFNDDLSTYWREHLTERHNISAEQVLVQVEDERYSLIGEISVEFLRKIQCKVSHGPTNVVPLGCSHTSVSLPDGIDPNDPRDKGKRREVRLKINENCFFVHGMSGRPGIA
ncbi:MAG: hypothetical protein HKL80_01785 [Acidimicrobiales bacterium]|nr:hypothetical protein [Acidimicrobiales bacterium]